METLAAFITHDIARLSWLSHLKIGNTDQMPCRKEMALFLNYWQKLQLMSKHNFSFSSLWAEAEFLNPGVSKTFKCGWPTSWFDKLLTFEMLVCRWRTCHSFKPEWLISNTCLSLVTCVNLKWKLHRGKQIQLQNQCMNGKFHYCITTRFAHSSRFLKILARQTELKIQENSWSYKR